MSELILQQREVRLATIDLKALQAQQKVTDEELKAYYDQNKNSFIAPEQMKISFIAMDAAAMQDKTTVTEEDIAAYYDQHKSSYTQPERRNYSVIQFKTEAEAKAALDELKKGLILPQWQKRNLPISSLARMGRSGLVGARNHG